MIPALQGRLGSRFCFVVGKGGVGKTTTSGAIALAFADRGIRTHLISTDPAHSLGDLFEQTSLSQPTTSRCAQTLILEELDARAAAEAWLAGARAALLDLVERGTYLDRADANSLLALSLPGVDEIMGALRLADLAASDAERIVVDTAPTGHTLRLLDAGTLIAGWTATLRAMADKAGVVASTLMRRTVRMPAEDLIDEMESRVARFESDVLRTADFVVVTRSGSVVEEETARLIDELKRRNLRIAARLLTGESSTDMEMTADTIVIPARADLRGCDALREWGRPEQQDTLAGELPSALPPALPWLQSQRADLLLFVGKGGVGKSTCAAACAVALAETRNVSLFSTDPAGSLSDVLARPVTGEGVHVSERLRARQLDATSIFASMRAGYRHDVASVFESIGIDASLELDRRVLDSLWEIAPPGLDEIMALLEIIDETASGTTLIVDSAPTGHFLRLLEMPEEALAWTHAIMRILVKYHTVAALDAPAEGMLAFAKRLKELRARLIDPARTAAVVVTLDQPVVIAETQRLVRALQNAAVPTPVLLLNRADAGSGPREDFLRAAPAGELSTLPARILAPAFADPLIGTSVLQRFVREWKLID
jgi:arsenite/tail-anchored protein-transporting ATPase